MPKHIHRQPNSMLTLIRKMHKITTERTQTQTLAQVQSKSGQGDTLRKMQGSGETHSKQSSSPR